MYLSSLVHLEASMNNYIKRVGIAILIITATVGFIVGLTYLIGDAPSAFSNIV